MSEERIWLLRRKRLSDLADENGQFRFPKRNRDRTYTLEYVRWVTNGGAHALKEAKRILG